MNTAVALNLKFPVRSVVIMGEEEQTKQNRASCRFLSLITLNYCYNSSLLLHSETVVRYNIANWLHKAAPNQINLNTLLVVATALQNPTQSSLNTMMNNTEDISLLPAFQLQNSSYR